MEGVVIPAAADVTMHHRVPAGCLSQIAVYLTPGGMVLQVKQVPFEGQGYVEGQKTLIITIPRKERRSRKDIRSKK